MTGKANTSTAQLVDSALNELIAGVLEFERGKPRRPRLVRAESGNEESNGGVNSPGVREVSRTLSSGQCVSYRIQEGWLGKEAVDIRPLLAHGVAEKG